MIYHLMYIVGDEMLHTIMMKDEIVRIYCSYVPVRQVG
jgi:hypothetical protein